MLFMIFKKGRLGSAGSTIGAKKIILQINSRKFLSLFFQIFCDLLEFFARDLTFCISFFYDIHSTLFFG